MQRSTITLDTCSQLHVAASIEDRRTVVTQQPVHEDDVTGSSFVDTQVDAFANHTNAGSVDEQLVTGPPFDNLGIARNYFYAGLRSRRRHSPCHIAHCFDRQALLNYDRTRQVERYRAAHRQVINRAADRQLTNIATGKIQWLDHVGICGESKSIAKRHHVRQTEPRLVLQRRLILVVKCLKEDVVDQIVHRLAAATVGESDRCNLHLAAMPGLAVPWSHL